MFFFVCVCVRVVSVFQEPQNSAQEFGSKAIELNPLYMKKGP